jgi:hypothetical protein
MEVAEKKNKNKKYKPILEGIPDWPVYQLSKNRKDSDQQQSNFWMNLKLLFIASSSE